MAQQQRKVRPIKLSHVGLMTTDVATIRDWYCRVLNAEVVAEKLPYFSTVTYDDEHHRLAIVGFQGRQQGAERSPLGFAHIAFGINNIFDLLYNYERLRVLGVKPAHCMNHGPTISFYYKDPDGNQCELFVDRFPTGEAAKNYMRGPVFGYNMGVGVSCDPEALPARMKAGAGEDELTYYDDAAGMKVDVAAAFRAASQN